MIASGDLRPGNTFLVGNDIYVCMDASHNKTARAAANIKIKMKNLRTGAITSTTFGPSEKFAPAVIDKVDMQFLYSTGDAIVFMNQETYEQVEIPATLLEWELNFIKEQSVCQIRMYNNEVLGVELKPKVILNVIEAEPSVKGDTATNVQIKVKVETGYELYTPAFVKEGDNIEISTADGTYSGRG